MQNDKSGPVLVRELADYVALVYHEARNVRHLIKAGHVPLEGWERIVSLPTNRDAAWHELTVVRNRAQRAATADMVLEIYEKRFVVSLQNLLDLYYDPNWKHAKAYGGNAWAKISALVIEFAEAIASEDEGAVPVLRQKLQAARHNSGGLLEKLAKLDRTL